MEGAEPYTELIREVAAVGYRALQVEPIAVRGERLNLAHTTMRTADGFETVSLYVNECDDHGLATYSAEYDEHDLVAAIDDLDVRYIAGEGAPDAEMLTHARTVIRAYDRHEWDALRSMLADDFVSADHRTVGFGTVGPDEFIDLCRVGLEMMPDYVQVCRWLTVVGRAALGTFDGSGTLHDGGRYEWTIHFLQQMDAQGTVRRIEWFDQTDLDAATARLQELGAPPVTGPALENAATAATARTLALLDQARWDDVRALYSDEFVRIDRRAVIGDGVVPGVHAQMDNLRAIYSSTVDVAWSVIAVRGDRLALDAVRLGGRGLRARDAPARRARCRRPVRSSRRLRCRRCRGRDSRLLDDRYLRGEGAAHREVLLAAAAYDAAATRGDGEALRAFLSPDLVVRDRNPIGFGDGDLDYYLASLAVQPQIADRGDDVTWTVEVVGRTLLATGETHFITPEGNDDTEVLCTLLDFDPSNVIRSIEWYPVDRYDEAVARLHELGVPKPSSSLENQATLVEQAAMATVDAYLRSGGALELVFPRPNPDYVVEDRRPIVGMPEQDASGTVAVISTMLDQGYAGVTAAVVAVRGDRLALVRRRFVTVSGDETRSLVVTEIDGDGRLAHQTMFAGDDLEAAMAELDARFLAGEGAGSLPVLAAGVAWIDASRSRDIDALRAVVAPDLVCVDHQPLGFGTLDCRRHHRGDAAPVRGLLRRRRDRPLGAGRRPGRPGAALRGDGHRRGQPVRAGGDLRPARRRRRSHRPLGRLRRRPVRRRARPVPTSSASRRQVRRSANAGIAASIERTLALLNDR